MYLQFDPEGLQTIHRSIMDDLRGDRRGWLRITVDVEA